jgi:pyruvate/2-oxoglutarate dehydrogenase complex dihydrolipoamide dehydrogenase (E3) component
VSEVLEPDLCVIGAGSAGLSVAAIAASFGVPVVLIERGRMGGECLNAGCVPSKALIAAGERRHAAEAAAAFGALPPLLLPAADFFHVRDHIRSVVAAIAPNDSQERYTAMGVMVLRESARFTDANTVVAGSRTIRARRFVIATGSQPALPRIPGLETVPHFTNETVFDIAERPARLVVIGGGPVGVEIAQAYHRLGTPVTVVEAEPRLLAREDPELAGAVERTLMREGIDLRLGTSIERAESRGSGIVLTLRRDESEESIEGSHLLVATGRRPVVEDLGLEVAGIAHDRTGITVDRGLRTANRRVYAIGDAAGGPAAAFRFTHAANHQAGLVIRNALFRLPVRVDAAPVPRVTYTDPELAAVGLSEEEVRAKRQSFRILRWPFAENDRAQAEQATAGLVKAIVTPRGRVLGCGIAGAHAGELIVPWTLAIAKGLKVQDLAGLVFPYPTFSEVTKRAAVEFIRPATQAPWARRAINLVRRLG